MKETEAPPTPEGLIYVPQLFRDHGAILTVLMRLEWLQVTEARKEYFMSEVPREYTYGTGPHARTYASNPYSPTVQVIQDQLNTRYATAYNVCFLNRYDSQKQQLGWHADDSPEMDREHPIAVVSFGAEREIWWKHKDQKGIVPHSQRQLLQSGSLFVMPAFFQDEHLHRIPRADREVGVRISLTFRRYKKRE
jgi:alkylated DNA repair dioxygenase AlkB